MNIYTELNKIVEYIEENLESKIDYSKLANMIGVNEYTFQKIFSLISGISISEYIRNRRLSNAGQDILLTNNKIIDIAVKYQYNNATSFSRAFEKFHGMKPSDVRKKVKKVKMYTKLHFDEISDNSSNIEYEVVEMESLTLYGKHITTTNEKIGNDAPKFYKKMEKIYGEPKYGMVEYYKKDRMRVKSYYILYDECKSDLEKIEIPKSKWILIRILSQEAKDIQYVSNAFYTKFLKSCKYNFRDLPEIEYYHDNVTDFLIPIEN